MRSKLLGFCREPLVHFLAIGAGFFLFWHFFENRFAARSQKIIITPGQVERLAQQWTKTHLRPPSSEELIGLVEQEIDEEVLYREAIEMGLDRDDLVIRRRLAVKMEFLTDDIAAVAVPTDEQLQAFFREHPERFALDSLTTFAQVYLNRSTRGAGASAEAERLLAQLQDDSRLDWQTLGDPLPLPKEFERAPDADVARSFGREFPKKLSALPVGSWSGPVESTYGLHLVLIRKRTAGRLPPLNDVREAVLNEWRAAQRLDLNENLRRLRRAKFAVTVQWPDWAKQPVIPTAEAGTLGGSR